MNTCSRCPRRYHGRGPWNGVFEGGRLVGLLCPDCQTPDENTEAVINEATTEYGLDPLGRAAGRAKGGGTR